MMDLEYFKTQIEEEIQGEADYRAKAVEYPEFDTMFTRMANQEHEHAENLLAMLKKIIDEASTVYNHFKE